MTVTYFTNKDKDWWKHSTIYQIYPSSFKDSNGDGVGDIPGIISKLDYLRSVGVDVVWLSPHYKSPQVDMGYDISDYKDIYEKYGTLKDCDKLIEQCHARGMRIIFDLVVNHTSDQHAWFQESKSSKDSPKRDWYIWRPAKYDENGLRHPPNNWASFFGGSAWEWDENTQEYYLHLFTKEQPDVNWRNLGAREAVYNDAIIFWLDKGVDGFRIDTVEIYSKPEVLVDAPVTDPDLEFQNPSSLVREGSQLHEIVREMNDKGFSKYDCMTVGEGSPTTYEEILKYISEKRHELNLVFQFDVFNIGKNNQLHVIEPYGLSDIKRAVSKWQRLIIGTDGWTTAFLENHDGGRSVSRFASDSEEFRVSSAKLLSVFLSTLSGTLFLYQGQEIGMVNIPKDWPMEDYKDVETLQAYDIEKERCKGDPEKMKILMKYIHAFARDHARTPVQWDDSEHGGFTSGKPWMKVNSTYPDINVQKQLYDPYSTLSFWKSMLNFRKENKPLTIYGDFELIDEENESVFSYSKSKGDEKLIIVLNFSNKPQSHKIANSAKLLLSTHVNHQRTHLQAFEGVVYKA